MAGHASLAAATETGTYKRLGWPETDEPAQTLAISKGQSGAQREYDACQ